MKLNNQTESMPQIKIKHVGRRNYSKDYKTDNRLKSYIQPNRLQLNNSRTKGSKLERKTRKQNKRVLKFLIEQYKTKFMNDGEDLTNPETKEYLIGMERQIRKLEIQLLGSNLSEADLNYYRY